MKLQYAHTKSFLLLTHEGHETGNRICQVLTEVDAQKSVQKINRGDDPLLTSRREADDGAIVRRATSAVVYAEDAAMVLTEVTCRRKMAATEEHIHLILKVRQLGARLYRNLWEVALNASDKKIMRNLIKKIALFSVWEDLPATMRGYSYTRVRNEMFGTVAYEHVYGVTFMEYKAGQAVFGWTVLRSSLEDSITVARSNVELAEKLLKNEYINNHANNA
jgi:hypothetical protein